MKKSIPEYKKLQSILIQQRLWSQNNEQESLQPLWNELSNQATRIFDVLSSFSEIMKEIKNINMISDNSVSMNNQENSSKVERNTIFTKELDLIITALSKPRYFTLEQLSIISNLDKKTILDLIEQLLEKRMVEKRKVGSKIQIRLHDEIIGINDHLLGND